MHQLAPCIVAASFAFSLFSYTGTTVSVYATPHRPPAHSNKQLCTRLCVIWFKRFEITHPMIFSGSASPGLLQCREMVLPHLVLVCLEGVRLMPDMCQFSMLCDRAHLVGGKNYPLERRPLLRVSHLHPVHHTNYIHFVSIRCCMGTGYDIVCTGVLQSNHPVQYQLRGASSVLSIIDLGKLGRMVEELRQARFRRISS